MSNDNDNDHSELEHRSTKSNTTGRRMSNSSTYSGKGRTSRPLSNSSEELAGIAPSPRKGRTGRRLPGGSPRQESRPTLRGDNMSVAGMSVSTMESLMSKGARAGALKDLEDDADGGDKIPSSPWFCYRIMLALIVAVLVSVSCFMASCKAFRFQSWDDGVQYYGIRGVIEPNTDRCIPWKTQDMIDWNKAWTDERLPMLFGLGIAGITFIVAIAMAWVVYGLVLKSKRESIKARVDLPEESDTCIGAIGPAVIIGVLLIGTGLLLFVTIMGNCSNLPPKNPYPPFGELKCNLHTWSALALTASIALCTMGGTLAFFLKCCCDSCLCTRFLRKQLIEP